MPADRPRPPGAADPLSEERDVDLVAILILVVFSIVTGAFVRLCEKV